LHLTLDNKESGVCWVEFLREMMGRGLRAPTSLTSDGAPGLVNVIEGLFSKSLRIHCWYHKMSNIWTKLPAEGIEEVLAHARALRDAPTYEAGEARAAFLVERFGERRMPVPALPPYRAHLATVCRPAAGEGDKPSARLSPLPHR